jgi:hypothetical protein
VRVTVYNFGVTATQTLYNGLQTNNLTQTEQQVLAAREMLRSTEHAVLFNGAMAYVKLLRDVAILELQRSNVNVLEVTLRRWPFTARGGRAELCQLAGELPPDHRSVTARAPGTRRSRGPALARPI